MNRKFLGLMATAFAFCSTVSCSGDKSASDLTGVALNDSTAGEARTPGPSAVTDLQASATDTSVTLSFTQVNDGTGQPAKYDVRFAAAPISWSAAPSVTSGTCATPVAGTAPGTQFSCTVLGLTPATSYNFQLVPFRGTMNQNAVYGPLSNIASAATTSRPPPPAPVASVTVTPASATLDIGATVQLQVSAFDANNQPLTGRVVTSSSADSAIASVNSAGLVTAASAGTTQITATSEGKSAIATITVAAAAPPPPAPAPPPPPPPSGNPGTVANLQASGPASTSVTLSFTQVDDGTGQPAKYNVRYAIAPIGWGSAASTTSGTCTTPVAGTAIGSQLTCTVLGLTPATNYNFQLVAFRGTMNLNAVYGALSNIAAATTTSSTPPPPAPVASVTVTPTSATLAIGATVQLQVSAFDANNNPLTGRVVTSSSANAGIASVNSAGLVTAVSAGTTQITVTSEGKSATAAITVSAAAPAPVATVTVSPASSSVQAGATAQFSAVTRDAANNTLTGRSIAWSSSNTSVATISSAGLVTAVAAGSATITASSEGKTGTAALTVTAVPPVPVASVTVTPTTASLLIGATVQLTVTARDANNNVLTGRTVTSQSANAGIASVTSLGVVKGVAVGTTQITVTVEGKTAIATITVTAPAPAPVATVTVSPASASLQVGATSQLSATLRDASNNVLTGRAITWSTANAGIASANASGLVTANGAGSTQITATSEGKTGSATITVTAVPPPPPPGGNEPAGLTVISDRPFNSTTATYTQGEAGWWDSDNGSLAIISDATAPRSPNNVARMVFNGGIVGGYAPSTLEHQVNATTIYVATWVKFSPNWQSHSSGVNKILHLWIGGGNHVVITAAGLSYTGSSALTARISLQGISGGGNNNDGSGTYESNAQFIRGQWHKLEVVGVANTAGANNGSVKVYMDGVLATQCSGINFGGTSWSIVSWAPVWGGTGDQVAATQYEYMDHIYLSGK